MFSVKVVSVPVKVISSVQIKVVSVELYSMAKVEAYLLDASNKIVERKAFVITGQEYQGWNEDSYLETLILLKLNMTKESTAPDSGQGTSNQTGSGTPEGSSTPEVP